MPSFETGAELQVSVDQRSLKDAKDEIESAIDDPALRVDAEISGGRS